jgi:DNA invertase Pin-like site-specific DNA recombinase
MSKRAAIYVRVSTDHQTVENQVQELRTIAERRGWLVVETYSDAGISGTKGRDKRPGLDCMLKDASRGHFDVVMAVAIDRLGRSLLDLLSTFQHLDACKTDILIDKQAIDTTTPMGRLLFHITGAFAEFERAMIVSRVNAGLRRARKAGTRLGRPTIDATKEKAIRKALAKGDKGMLKIAAELGVGSGTVQRIKAAMAA